MALYEIYIYVGSQEERRLHYIKFSLGMNVHNLQSDHIFEEIRKGMIE